MELSGQTLLPGTPEQAWALLHDPERLRAALPGCETLQADGPPGHYRAELLLSVGPLKARFQSRLELYDLQPPQRYRLRAQAQGGAAGHGKGEAEVELRPEADQGTRLQYRAQVQVGGRLAQLGARLIEPAARQLSQTFFEALASQLAAAAAPAPSPLPPAVRPWWRRCWDWLCRRRASLQ
ncbi:MAG: carbon monoxide dehydrogenase subunit G [Inhella sp.]